jgi:hypothetical protein
MSKYFVGGLPPLRNSTSCTLALRHLLAGTLRKDAVNHTATYCPDLIQYPERSVLSPVLKLFYNKSRIVSFYDKQNFGDKLPKLTADVFCVGGTFMCTSISTTLNDDVCWNYEEFLRFVALPFFAIPFLFCQMAKDRDNILQRSVFLTS